jgi:2-keto-4-pentenoate hydratase
VDPMTRAAAARQLLDAYGTGKPIPPLTSTYDDMTVEDAYAVQLLQIEERLAEGRLVKGHKVGLTSAAMQRLLGVDEPDYGHLLDDFFHLEHVPIPLDRFLQPRIEPEVAFVLAKPLRGPGVTVHEAIAAVDFVLPALEIVDSRIAGWDITFVDTVADNASSGLYVLGDSAGPLGDRDLTAVEMTMTRADGSVASSGSGAACLGDPVNALVWLARTAAELGEPLRAGDVVLSGALGPMVPVAAGDAFAAELSGLGAVRVSFT